MEHFSGHVETNSAERENILNRVYNKNYISFICIALDLSYAYIQLKTEKNSIIVICDVAALTRKLVTSLSSYMI